MPKMPQNKKTQNTLWFLLVNCIMFDNVCIMCVFVVQSVIMAHGSFCDAYICT